MRILVVDDDPSVLITTAELLEMMGHVVSGANDGLVAKFIVESGKEYDVIITDNNMTNMDGHEFLRWFRTEHEPFAKTKLIIVSGIAANEINLLIRDFPDIKFLPKPYSPKKLMDNL